MTNRAVSVPKGGQFQRKETSTHPTRKDRKTRIWRMVLIKGVKVVTGLCRVFPINPLGESLGPELSYFIANPLKKKP
ncbi:hypothetical protein TNCV_4038531 [Trichonephila clavipes]|nr:hypothetical protein TNCV_4038531 [Trichonephila clavipes]